MTNALSRTPKVINNGPIFEARLVPHRSLGRSALIRLGLLMTVLWGGIGLFFLSLGAWPVFGFFGLDLLLFIWLLWLNAREGRTAETVSVSRTLLEVRKHAASGRERVHRMNPFGTRFEVERHEMIGVTNMVLKTRAETVSIGAFLNPADKDSFASALSGALAKARA